MYRTHQGKARTRRSTRWAGKSIIYRLFWFRARVSGRGDVWEKENLTVRKSLSSRGGYRGGCGAREGEDVERRTPNLFHRLLLLRGAGGCAWERTKVMDGSVESDERILLSLL